MGTTGQTPTLHELNVTLQSVLSAGIQGSAVKVVDENFLARSDIRRSKAFTNARAAEHFCLGRVAARKALARLLPDVQPVTAWELQRNKDGSVEWPSGAVGSISHSKGAAIAAVARLPQYRALGLDLEFHRIVHARTMARVCLANEEIKLADVSSDENKRFFHIFSAKEAIFKALAPLVKRNFGFRAVQLESVKAHTAVQIEKVFFELSFRLNEQLSEEFARDSVLPVFLARGSNFSITICALPGL